MSNLGWKLKRTLFLIWVFDMHRLWFIVHHPKFIYLKNMFIKPSLVLSDIKEIPNQIGNKMGSQRHKEQWYMIWRGAMGRPGLDGVAACAMAQGPQFLGASLFFHMLYCTVTSHRPHSSNRQASWRRTNWHALCCSPWPLCALCSSDKPPMSNTKLPIKTVMPDTTA